VGLSLARPLCGLRDVWLHDSSPAKHTNVLGSDCIYVMWNIVNGHAMLRTSNACLYEVVAMSTICWEHFPLAAKDPHARAWLTMQAHLGLAPNTIHAYGYAVEDYFAFSTRCAVPPATATKAHIAAYVRDLSERPNPHGAAIRVLNSGAGLANATMLQRITAVRLFYDYLLEEGIRDDNPVGRGRYTPGKGFGGARDRALVPHYRKLPWIPNDEEWAALLQATKHEPLRNRVMFAFGYDAALRREELCALTTSDINPGQRLLTIRAETTKNRQTRVVPYSEATSALYAPYLHTRRTLSRARGPLFLSQSHRNRAQPISIWTWSKVVAGISARAGVVQFTTHTLRHLCLTDLARAGWDLHEIATFAGHRSTETTLQYIHLSGRELAQKLERGMASIHTWRAKMLAEVLA
jgi:integrase/recombinase XerD